MKDTLTHWITIILLVFIAIISTANLALQLIDRTPAWPPTTQAPFQDPSIDTEITPSPQSSISSFEQCIQAGYPVLESYPRQCAVPGGETFTEELPQ